jgi:FkbM family methyltransferase
MPEAKTPSFYSQHGEDKWIAENLLLPEKGVFVDVGAYDGLNASNSLYFEQKGWTGICVEPDPRLWILISERRKCPLFNVAVGTNPNAIFQMNRDISLSGFGRGGIDVRIPVHTLETILRSANISQIDLLSIDTEGCELDVWSSFEHNIYKPRIVIIEYDTAGLPSNEEGIKSTFATLPYRLAHRTKGNLIFERTGA